MLNRLTLLNPLLRLQKYPETIFIRHTRSFKPTVKIGRERFQITLDLSTYNQDEITVKAHPQYVVIEGKKERETAEGYTVKQFVKKFRLPDGCKIKEMRSSLSPEGILTVVAPRSHVTPELANIVIIPIIPEGRKSEGKVKKSSLTNNPCRKYPKVIPIKKK
ncbi:protein lethal(2)essential for life-like [Anticarsia gemmatalis]|uniref:protein lethal(2)essential for life-like n=1 Tax=Anticarsia gemmatalis TaxID=129554 RepID=UPI003F75DA2B